MEVMVRKYDEKDIPMEATRGGLHRFYRGKPAVTYFTYLYSEYIIKKIEEQGELQCHMKM